MRALPRKVCGPSAPSDGEEYAEVKAQDFVTGLKYAADENSEAIYLVQDSVKGLDAYIKGEDKNFDNVGVKAIDDRDRKSVV